MTMSEMQAMIVEEMKVKPSIDSAETIKEMQHFIE
ncbi:TPA: NAD(+) synthase, partial [Staphylococcus pseudintermedius]|nr:NAD(+) synthase [Staphylococcus pseudintermedius]